MADISELRSYFRLHPADWVSPARLLARFSDLPDRTLRRWMAELVAEGLVERTGSFKGTRYRLRSPANIAEVQAYEVREPVAPFAPPDRRVFAPASLEVLRRVDAPIYTRPPVTYAEDRLDHYIPNHTSYLTSAQRASLRSLGQRAPIYGHAGTYVRRI